MRASLASAGDPLHREANDGRRDEQQPNEDKHEGHQSEPPGNEQGDGQKAGDGSGDRDSETDEAHLALH